MSLTLKLLLRACQSFCIRQNYKKVLQLYVLTKGSSCFSKVDNDLTQVSRFWSWGSIRPQSRDTTFIAECRLSLWTLLPNSRIKVSPHCKPPASNTAPASLVHTNSKTCWNKYHWIIFKYKPCELPFLLTFLIFIIIILV